LFDNKTLLITGGTGSFGNAVVDLLLKTNISKIIIFSRDEKKQDEMRNKYNNNKLKLIVGDVRDFQNIKNACRNVNFIFHAAALKQVPSCEFYPLEAIKTNILGTENVLNSAIENGVEKIVCLSTDKACYPINVMGMSKAMMEKLVISKARNELDCYIKMCVTRYGNVMATRGSVIPLFVKQITSGKNITITDPNMTRFLMSLDEAINLVVHALLYGNSGDLFVQKSPACTIANLAEGIRQIFNPETKIITIGTRHGEKVHETLLTREEMFYAEDMGLYFRVAPNLRELNYNEYLESNNINISEMLEYTSFNTQQLSVEEIIDKLLTLNFIQEELKMWKNQTRL
jgi:UDP-N-acetylglucosamine 4,6-dehydratase/5-epimerase